MKSDDAGTDEVRGVEKILAELRAAQTQMDNASTAWKAVESERTAAIARLDDAQAEIDMWYEKEKENAHPQSDWALNR